MLHAKIIGSHIAWLCTADPIRIDVVIVYTLVGSVVL